MSNLQTSLFFGILVSLTACQQPETSSTTTVVKEKVTPTKSTLTMTEDYPRYQTDSYVLAQPLPNHQLKIAINAQDKSLFISNCNQHLVYGIFGSPNHKMLNDMASDACASEDIAIPAYATLSFVVNLDELIGINGDPIAWSNSKTYYVAVPSISIYDRNYEKVALEQQQITSNTFTLLP